MNAILIHVNDDEKAAIASAAKAIGLTRKAFIRRAAVQLAQSLTGGDKDLLGMVRDLHRALCGSGSSIAMSDEAQDAATALVNLGHPRALAEKRAAAISTADPGLDAAGIITRACSPKGT